MSNITTTIRNVVTEESLSTPTIYNVTITLANTEVSQLLSNGTQKILIKVRGNSNLQLAFVSGQSGTNYITIPSGTNYEVGGLNFTGSLYFQTSKPSQIVEILEWV